MPGLGGQALNQRPSMRATSALACSMETPGLSRAIPWPTKGPRNVSFRSKRWGENQLGIVLKTEFLRHHADYRTGPRTARSNTDTGRAPGHRERTPDDGGVATEAALPVAVGEYDRLGRSRRVVSLRKPPAQQRLHSQGIEHSVGDEERHRHLWLGNTGEAHARGTPQSEVLKGPVLLAIREIDGRRTADRPGNTR
jgi:hypothetical protein